MFVAILEGENPNWEFDDAANDNLNHFYVVYSSKEYPKVDYFSGAGVALLVPSTVGVPGTGDQFRYGAGTLFSSDYFRLPAPSTGAYRYNVYAYYYPHTTSGNWRVSIRENGILSSTLLEKDISGYSSVNKGRTSVALGQIQINGGLAGIDIDLTAISAGAGGNATLFFDGLVFVRVM